MTTSVQTGKQSLRERTREAVREEIRRAAIELFVERGFEETRTEEIAAAAGISARSFFRYFTTKEDVLISGSFAFGAHVREALQARPSDEDIWVALRRSLDVLINAMDANQNQSFKMMSVIMGTASLRAAHFEKHLAWEEMLLPEIAARLGESEVGLRTRAIAHSAMASLDVGLSEWVRRDGATNLSQLVDETFAAQGH